MYDIRSVAVNHCQYVVSGVPTVDKFRPALLRVSILDPTAQTLRVAQRSAVGRWNRLDSCGVIIAGPVVVGSPEDSRFRPGEGSTRSREAPHAPARRCAALEWRQ